MRPSMLKIDSSDGSETYLNIHAIASISLVRGEKGESMCYVATNAGGVMKLPAALYDKILDYCDFLKTEVPEAFYTSFGDEAPEPERPRTLDPEEFKKDQENDEDDDLTIPV